LQLSYYSYYLLSDLSNKMFEQYHQLLKPKVLDSFEFTVKQKFALLVECKDFNSFTKSDKTYYKNLIIQNHSTSSDYNKFLGKLLKVLNQSERREIIDFILDLKNKSKKNNYLNSQISYLIPYMTQDEILFRLGTNNKTI